MIHIWHSLKSVCKKLNIRLGAAKGLCIGQMLINRKPACNPLDRVGGVIYKISCSSCNTIYIGETVQTMKLWWMSQHNASCLTAIQTRKIASSEKRIVELLNTL